LRSQSKPATRANWKQVGRKAAKKFQNGEGRAVSYLAQVGKKVSTSGLHTLSRKHQGNLGATSGLASL
jgi:hypothetical protein